MKIAGYVGLLLVALALALVSLANAIERRRMRNACPCGLCRRARRLA